MVQARAIHRPHLLVGASIATEAAATAAFRGGGRGGAPSPNGMGSQGQFAVASIATSSARHPAHLTPSPPPPPCETCGWRRRAVLLSRDLGAKARCDAEVQYFLLVAVVMVQYGGSSFFCPKPFLAFDALPPCRFFSRSRTGADWHVTRGAGLLLRAMRCHGSRGLDRSRGACSGGPHKENGHGSVGGTVRYGERNT